MLNGCQSLFVKMSEYKMSEIYTDSLTAFLQDTPFVFPVSAYIEYENNCAQQQIEIPGRDIGTGSIVYPCRHGCAQRNSCHISCIAYPVYGRKFPCTKKTSGSGRAREHRRSRCPLLRTWAAHKKGLSRGLFHVQRINA